MKPQIRRFDVTGDSPIRVQALVVDSTDTPILVANTDTIEFRVYLGEEQQNQTEDLVVADVLFDTLQTTNGWDVNATGFNFEHVIASDEFYRLGGRMYYAEYKFTMTDTTLGPLYVRAHLVVDPTFGGVV